MAGNVVEIRITASGAEQAAKVLQSVGAAGGQIGTITTSGAAQAERAINTLGTSAKRVFEIFTGITAAGAVAKLVEMGKAAAQSGLEAMQAERAFRGMTEALGINGDAVLAKMQAVSKGLADQSDLMLASARGLQQGLSDNQLVKVLELATDKAKLAGKSVAQAYGEMSDAISENSVRSLKQFGIVLNLDDVMKNYATTLGTFPEALSAAEKTQAIFNATMEAAAKQTRSATTALDEQVDRLERNKVRVKGFWEDVGVVIVNAHADLLAFWQDFDKAADDFGRRKMSELGVGLAPGPAEGLAGGIGTSDITRGGPSAPVPIPPEVIAAPDLLKRALAEADHALKMLNATMAAGLTSSADYAAGLQASISKLQALGTSLDEDGKLKLLGFQAALAAINFTKFQQDLSKSLQATQAWGSGLISSVKESVAQWNTTAEQGAVALADIDVARLAADRARLAQALVDFKGNEAQKFQLEQQYAALGIQLAEAKSAQRIAVWTKETAALKDFVATLNSGIDTALAKVTQGLDEQSRALIEAAEAEKKYTDAMDVMMAGSDGAADEFDRIATAAKLSGKVFQEDLGQIAITAQLLGPNFDASGAAISRMQQRLKELSDAAKGEITPAMRELAGQINGMIDTHKLNEALGLTRTTFDFMVDAARSTAQNMTSAFSDLFFNLFTGNLKSALDVFKSFALSMLRVLSDFLAQTVVKKFLSFLTAEASTPGSPGAIAAAGGANSPVNDDSTSGGFDSGLQSGLSATGGVVRGAQFFSSASNVWSTISSAASNAWGGFNAALDAGGSVLSGFSGAIDSAGVALSDLNVGLSGMGLALGYVGAAVGALLTIMDNAKSDIGKAVQTATLVAGAALAPFTAGISLVVAPIINWLEDLFGLFHTGPSNYDLKRIKAADDASTLVGGIGTGFATAARTGSAADILAALVGGQAPAGSTPNPLRTDLSLPPALAEQLGLASKAEIENGRAIIHWADVTQAQFNQLIELFKTDPSMIAGSIVGKGDVSYLTPDKVKQYTDALQSGAVALLTAFSALEDVRDKINSLAADILDAAQAVMPPDMAAQLADYIVTPIRDAMLAVVQTPDITTEEMQKQLDALSKTLEAKVQAWAKFADALKSIDLAKALMPGDLGAQMSAAIQPAYDAVITAMRTGTAKQAQLAVDAFDKLAAAWVSFGQAATQKLHVEAILDGLPDLGARFAAVMGPEYDKILATLQAGNANLAAAQTALFNRRLAVFAALGQSEVQGQGVAAGLAASPDLGDRFRAVMQPAWDKILGDIETNVELAAVELEKFNKQLAAFAAVGQTEAQGISIDALLPTDLEPKFKAAMQPAWDKMLADLVTNVDLAAIELDKITRQLKAWASIGQTMTQVTAEIAANTQDPAAGIAAWQQVQNGLTTMVDRAKIAFDAAISSGDVEQIAAASANYHDAVMANLQAELEMVKRIEAAFQAALDAAATLVQQVTDAAKIDLTGSGGFGMITSLLGALQGMAESGSTAAQKLWAVNQALGAIVAILPTAIAKFGGMQHAADWLASGPQTAGQLQASGPRQITSAVTTAAAPFLMAMQGLIDAAAGPEKLALLQQQASQWNALADAAIAGVNQWAEQAIKGARDAADEVIASLTKQKDAALEAIDLEIAAIQDKTKVAHDARMAEIEQIQTAEKAAAEFRAAEMAALDKAITKAEEWESAIESMGKFIAQLRQGPLGPGNPAAKLQLAQDQFAKALQAYTATPTAKGLTDLQDIAQRMLGLADTVFTKPSPQFQALSAMTLRQLTAAQALAAGQMTDSDVLKAQLEALKAADKAATQGVADQIAAIQAADKAATEKSDTLIEALNAQKKSITDDFETQTAAIEKAFTTQKEAIEQAAKDEIEQINAGRVAALQANFEQQAPLLAAQFAAANAMLAALGPTAQFQLEAVTRLTEIRDAINRATSVSTGFRMNPDGTISPIPQAASGITRVTEGFYYLHDDEMVIPKAAADRIRSMASGGGLPTDQDIDPRAGYGSGATLTPWELNPGGPGVPGFDAFAGIFTWSGPAAAQLNALERQINVAKKYLELQIAHNTSINPKTHTIRHHFTDQQLDAMRATLAEQIASIRSQQSAIIAATPPPRVAPPTGPVAPPTSPGGPGWLRGGSMATGPVKGAPAITINLTVNGPVDDPDALATAFEQKMLTLTRDDARGGVIHEIILDTPGRK